MLLPALGAARGKAKDINCRTNMKQLLLGTQYYSMDYNGYTTAVYPARFGGTNMECRIPAELCEKQENLSVSVGAAGKMGRPVDNGFYFLWTAA